MTQKLLPPLARQALDRDYLSRSKPELLSSLRDEPRALALLMHRGKVLLSPDSKANLRLVQLSMAPQSSLQVYLGSSTETDGQLPSGTPICLVGIDDEQASSMGESPENWVSLRATGAGLNDLDAGIFTQALALYNWHNTHSHCPNCGAPTVVEQAGWVRRCLIDDLELFPRTDPAIIVSIIDQHDRILLGSQGVWEENRWSILAGFVEPGESLEAAVVREMKEESGLDVSNPSYTYSQSWPYPYSLMLGFTATADSAQELKPDGLEISKLRWFSKEQILAEANSILLPGRASISRAMIELWFGSEIISATELSANGRR